MLHGPGEFGRPQQGRAHVGQRPEGHQGDLTGGAADSLHQDIGGVTVGGRAPGEIQADVAQPVGAVHDLRGHQLAEDGPGQTCVGRHRQAAQFGGVEGVLDAAIQRHVAGHDRQGLDGHVGRAQRHDQRHGVVGGGVGVDQESAHGALLSRLPEPRSRA